MSRLTRNASGLSRLVWTTGIALGASLPHWPALPLWIPLLLCTAIAWRFAAHLLRWPLPGKLLCTLITISAFVSVLLQYGTINGLAPGSALLVVMIALKFLESRGQRDHIVLTVISYFLVFAGLLSGGGIFKGIYLLVFVWVTTVGLLQVGRVGPLLPYAPTGRQAGKLLLQAIPFMAILFVVFPRLPGPLWTMPGDNSVATSGLTDSMSPGDITSLGLSDEIVFRAEFEGPEPDPSALYWRGPVLTRFDGRRWTRPEGVFGSVRDTLELRGDISRYRVTLDAGANNQAFALDMPANWTAEPPVSLRMDSLYQLSMRPRDTGSRRVSYSITSYSDYRAREPLDQRDIDEYLQLVPADRNPRTRALIDGWLAESGDTRDLIDRALEYFRTEEFFYTLTPPALGEHSVDEFIFATREGFCEHYASAFAVMMRMAGIPARVVTGYQGGERNRIGDYYIIRQADAHAWTEVWSEADGWQRVDPVGAVAPGRISLGSAAAEFDAAASITRRLGRTSFMRQIVLGWDAVNTAWNKWVIGYGPALQRDLFEWLGFERPGWRQLFVVSLALSIVGTFGLTIYLGLRRKSHRSPDAAARYFRRFQRRLNRLAIDPPPTGETPTAMAGRVVAALPEQAASIRAITSAYLTARYEPDRDGQSLRRLRELVNGFRPRCIPSSR